MKIEKLRRTWEALYALKLPNRTAGNEGISEIIDLLVLQDAHIVGLVSSYLKGSQINRKLVAFDKET